LKCNKYSEAGSSFDGGKYVELNYATVSINIFGTSAPGNMVYEKFGFTAKNTIAKYKELV
jgi:transketolase